MLPSLSNLHEYSPISADVKLAIVSSDEITLALKTSSNVLVSSVAPANKRLSTGKGVQVSVAMIGM